MLYWSMNKQMDQEREQSPEVFIGVFLAEERLNENNQKRSHHSLDANYHLHCSRINWFQFI